MLYIRKLGDDYLKILTDDKMKHFFKSAVEKTYPRVSEVQTLIRSNNKR